MIGRCDAITAAAVAAVAVAPALAGFMSFEGLLPRPSNMPTLHAVSRAEHIVCGWSGPRTRAH